MNLRVCGLSSSSSSLHHQMSYRFYQNIEPRLHKTCRFGWHPHFHSHSMRPPLHHKKTMHSQCYLYLLLLVFPQTPIHERISYAVGQNYYEHVRSQSLSPGEMAISLLRKLLKTCRKRHLIDSEITLDPILVLKTVIAFQLSKHYSRKRLQLHSAR